MKRNIIYNLIAGVFIAAIFAVISFVAGCEQPELKQHESNGIDSMQTDTNDSIESWDNDTTIYHSDAKPS